MPERRVGIEIGVVPKRAGAKQTQQDLAAIRREVRGLNTGFGKQRAEMAKVGRSARGLGSTFGNLRGQILGIAAGALSIGAVTAATRKLSQAAQESLRAFGVQQSAMTQVEAAIRSTGGSAGLTATELREMAAAMQEVTGVGDELILTAQSQLLTFTKIGREVFPEVIERALDLSERFDKGLTESVVQLGKALNDPVANLGELGRAGIQFSKSQKEQIKTLFLSGRALEAHRIILKELEVQFGGSARAARDTLPGALRALGSALGDAQEDIGEGMAPAVRDLTEAMIAGLKPGGEYRKMLIGIGKAAGDNLSALTDFGAGLFRLAEGLSALPSSGGLFGFLSQNVEATVRASPFGFLLEAAQQVKALGEAVRDEQAALKKSTAERKAWLDGIEDTVEPLRLSVDAMDDASRAIGVKIPKNYTAEELKKIKKAAEEAKRKLDELISRAFALSDIRSGVIRGILQREGFAIPQLQDAGGIQPIPIPPRPGPEAFPADSLNVGVDATSMLRTEAELLNESWARMHDLVGGIGDALASGFGAAGQQRLAAMVRGLADIGQGIMAFRGASRADRRGAGVSLGQSIGNTLGGALGGDYAGIGSTIGSLVGLVGGPVGAIIGGAIGGVLGGAIKHGAEEGIALITSGVDEALTAVQGSGGGLGRQIGRIADAIAETMEDLVAAFGGDITAFPNIRLKTREDITTVTIGFLERRFDDIDEAMAFAVREALRLADTTGLAPEVQQALQGQKSLGGDLDDLTRILNTAQFIADLRESGGVLSDVSGQIRQLTQAYFEQADAMRDVGVSAELLGRNLVTNLGNIRDQLLGLDIDDPLQQILSDIGAYNREALRLREDLERQIFDLAQRIRRAGFSSSVEDMLAGGIEHALDKFGNILGRIPSRAGEDVEALNRELEELQALFDSLPELISPEETRRRLQQERRELERDRREMREAFDEDARDFGLGDIGRQLLDVTRFIEDSFTRIAEAGFATAAALERQTQVEEEAARRREQITGDVLADIDRFTNLRLDVFGTGALGDIARIREQFRSLREDLEGLADSGLITSEAFDELDASLRRSGFARQFLVAEEAGRSLTQDVLVFLGRTEEAERLRFALSQAELRVRFEELRLVERQLGLIGEFTAGLGPLIDEALALTFEDFQNIQNGFGASVATFSSATDRFNDAANELRRAANSLKGLIIDLRLGPTSPLSPGDQLAVARRRLEELQAKARLGDPEAIAALGGATEDFLRALQAINPQATAAFAASFEDAVAFLEMIVGRFGGPETEIDVLRDVRTGINNQIAVTNNGNDEQAAASDRLRVELVSQLANVNNNLFLRRLQSDDQTDLIVSGLKRLEPKTFPAA